MSMWIKRTVFSSGNVSANLPPMVRPHESRVEWNFPASQHSEKTPRIHFLSAIWASAGAQSFLPFQSLFDMCQSSQDQQLGQVHPHPMMSWETLKRKKQESRTSDEIQLTTKYFALWIEALLKVPTSGILCLFWVFWGMGSSVIVIVGVLVFFISTERYGEMGRKYFWPNKQGHLTMKLPVIRPTTGFRHTK